MSTSSKRAFLAMAGIASLSAFSGLITGCVSDRPSRNGVFNENQYVRKAFLVAGFDKDGNPQKDPGWMLKSTITDISTPNPLGANVAGFFAGYQASEMVRFEVTQDHLNMINMRELSSSASTGRTELVDNAWPITNVDLKYRINLDGEKTNFYEENQELDWQVRQWVKINFAKNDFSDLAPFGPFATDALNHCVDLNSASATLVPDSFLVDEAKDYMQWSVKVSLPLKFDDATCVDGYGELGNDAIRIGKYGVTLNLKYSMMRAVPDTAITYTPFPIDEKDPIRHKYGPITYTSFNRDEASGQVAAQEFLLRFDPKKPIVWYFDKGFPEPYKAVFLGPGGIKDRTNYVLGKAGATAQVDFRNYDAPGDDGQPVVREFGDARFSFLRWVSDRDMQDSFAGVTQFTTDPRTGETLSASIVLNDFAIKDYYSQRIDAYLQYLGGTSSKGKDPWIDMGSCPTKDAVVPFLADAKDTHNANSTVFAKMQAYLQLPVAQYGHLAPKDMVTTQDSDFFRAYYALVPYSVFGDPDTNQYVIREGGAGVYGPAGIWKMAQDESTFHALTAKIDHGVTPFDDLGGPGGLKNAKDFANQMRSLTINHRNLGYGRLYENKYRPMDTPDSFSLEAILQRDGRRCIAGADGSLHWETRQEWEDSLIYTYWSQVFWHEFGHAMGLEHNFMASVDQPNFPPALPTKDPKGNTVYPLYASSVMEYNSAPDRVFWTPDWAPYDQGAIAWTYGNYNGATGGPVALDPTDPKQKVTSITGQLDAARPWNDPLGFHPENNQERMFLRCDDNQIKYTPLCRQGDLGITPSQIIANEIANYEWQYQWRNFRSYRKVWNNATYADSPAGLFLNMRRFLSLWAFDWGGAEISGTLHRIGINPPDTDPDAQSYYSQLSLKFLNEIAATNRLVGAFHEAIIQQSTGERPFATVYDPFYGDELQQGIILDKYFAMQDWVGLWPTDNYDQNQAGAYISSFGDFTEPSFRTVAETAVVSMIGGGYDVYPYFVPTAVALYAQDTHSPSFSGRIEARDWIGGFSFYRRQDFVDYFRQIAVAAGDCTDVATCKYDVTDRNSTHSDTWNEFQAPDGLIYIWSFIPDRNTYVLARKDRNIATYKIIHQYNDDVLRNLDDGSGGTYGFELPIKYTVDSFSTEN